MVHVVGSGTPEPGGIEQGILQLKKVQRMAVLQESLGKTKDMDLPNWFS